MKDKADRSSAADEEYDNHMSYDVSGPQHLYKKGEKCNAFTDFVHHSLIYQLAFSEHEPFLWAWTQSELILLGNMKGSAPPP